MRFDYGHYVIEVSRENGRWRVYRCGTGLRTPTNDVSIPPEVGEDELHGCLDEPCHALRRLD
ncbi:MAG: hypothetical protein DIU74_000710 [Pseudomonadota bacterium]|nr:MAG: hypothetical protein DIU74_00225 [Pseudomonadota bacterium]